MSLRLLAALAALLAASPAAHATDCMYHSPVHYDELFRRASAIFAGRVVSVAEVRESALPNAMVVAQRVTLRVREIWRGAVPATVTFVNRAARELVLYRAGEEAIVVADPWSSTERELGTSYCFRMIDRQPAFRDYLKGKPSRRLE
jgi:hypothetical protein